MANSKLHDDLMAEVGPWENVEENVTSLMNAIADRIDACNGNRVKLSDLSTVLRENPKAVSETVLKLAPVHVAPAPQIEKPVEKPVAEQAVT